MVILTRMAIRLKGLSRQSSTVLLIIIRANYCSAQKVFLDAVIKAVSLSWLLFVENGSDTTDFPQIMTRVVIKISDVFYEAKMNLKATRMLFKSNTQFNLRSYFSG